MKHNFDFQSLLVQVTNNTENSLANTANRCNLVNLLVESGATSKESAVVSGRQLYWAELATPNDDAEQDFYELKHEEIDQPKPEGKMKPTVTHDDETDELPQQPSET